MGTIVGELEEIGEGEVGVSDQRYVFWKMRL
jgi:hypothetical protein